MPSKHVPLSRDQLLFGQRHRLITTNIYGYLCPQDARPKTHINRVLIRGLFAKTAYDEFIFESYGAAVYDARPSDSNICVASDLFGAYRSVARLADAS